MDDAAFDECYQAAKTQSLRAGPTVAVRHIERLSAMRRCVREADKARRRLASMRERAAGQVAATA